MQFYRAFGMNCVIYLYELLLCSDRCIQMNEKCTQTHLGDAITMRPNQIQLSECKKNTIYVLSQLTAPNRYFVSRMVRPCNAIQTEQLTSFDVLSCVLSYVVFDRFSFTFYSYFSCLILIVHQLFTMYAFAFVLCSLRWYGVIIVMQYMLCVRNSLPSILK